mmetsp:Transcript_39471/g.85159  ORF Transcript_39471/g.85159 Transcript_39471/m.85159 type:complete len:205 (+) Transcript_39471:213-827(+)
MKKVRMCLFLALYRHARKRAFWSQGEGTEHCGSRDRGLVEKENTLAAEKAETATVGVPNLLNDQDFADVTISELSGEGHWFVAKCNSHNLLVRPPAQHRNVYGTAELCCCEPRCLIANVQARPADITTVPPCLVSVQESAAVAPKVRQDLSRRQASSIWQQLVGVVQHHLTEKYLDWRKVDVTNAASPTRTARQGTLAVFTCSG